MKLITVCARLYLNFNNNKERHQKNYAKEFSMIEGFSGTYGECFDMPGHLRIGFGNDRDVFETGLGILSDYIKHL